MKRIPFLFTFAALGMWSSAVFSASLSAHSLATPQGASAQAQGSAPLLAKDTKIVATLATTLDAKKSKPGDRVEARITSDIKQDGKVVLKKGTPLIGRVTEAQARTKDQKQSDLGIAFDYAVMKTGEQMPLHVTIQGMAAPQVSPAASDSSAIGAPTSTAFGTPDSSGAFGVSDSSGGTGLPAGVGSSFGDICDSTRVVTLAIAQAGDSVSTGLSAPGAVYNVGGAAPRNATGAVDDVDRSPAATAALKSDQSPSNTGDLLRNVSANNATQTTVLVSSTKNVYVVSGTKMLLNVNNQAETAATRNN